MDMDMDMEMEMEMEMDTSHWVTSHFSLVTGHWSQSPTPAPAAV